MRGGIIGRLRNLYRKNRFGVKMLVCGEEQCSPIKDIQLCIASTKPLTLRKSEGDQYEILKA